MWVLAFPCASSDSIVRRVDNMKYTDVVVDSLGVQSLWKHQQHRRRRRRKQSSGKTKNGARKTVPKFIKSDQSSGKTKNGARKIVPTFIKSKLQLKQQMLLHQADDSTPVDEIITLPGSKVFRDIDIERLCGIHLTACILNVPIAVVRLTQHQLKKKLKHVPGAQVEKLKDNLPKVVKYLKENIGLKDVKTVLREFENSDVIIPAEAIAKEFRDDGVELRNTTKHYKKYVGLKDVITVLRELDESNVMIPAEEFANKFREAMAKELTDEGVDKAEEGGEEKEGTVEAIANEMRDGGVDKEEGGGKGKEGTVKEDLETLEALGR